MTNKTGIYFVGEAIADQRPDPAHPRTMHVSLGGSMYFGSMGAATAIQTQKLETMQSFYVGPVSDDYFGGLFREDFARVQVGTDYIRNSPFISMLAVISEDGQGGNKYAFYGRNQMNTTEHLQLDQLPTTFKEENRIFVFGSVATTLSLSGATLKEFAKLQLQKECVVLFDPNTRPSVIPDLAKYRTGLEDWVKIASVVKASEEDIAFTYPDLSCEDVARHWLSLGVTAAFITRGDKGCSVFSKDGDVYVPAQTNPAITRTVGAGDNFNAGIAIALAKRSVTTREKLSALSLKEWEAVTAEANDTSYQHLLRLNNVLKAA